MKKQYPRLQVVLWALLLCCGFAVAAEASSWRPRDVSQWDKVPATKLGILQDLNDNGYGRAKLGSGGIYREDGQPLRPRDFDRYSGSFYWVRKDAEPNAKRTIALLKQADKINTARKQQAQARQVIAAKPAAPVATPTPKSTPKATASPTPTPTKTPVAVITASPSPAPTTVGIHIIPELGLDEVWRVTTGKPETHDYELVGATDADTVVSAEVSTMGPTWIGIAYPTVTVSPPTNARGKITVNARDPGRWTVTLKSATLRRSFQVGASPPLVAASADRTTLFAVLSLLVIGGAAALYRYRDRIF